MSLKLQVLRESKPTDLHSEERKGPAQNVLLISPSYVEGKNTHYFPIGLSYISSYVRRVGHHVVALNMNHLEPEEGWSRLDDILTTQRIDVVGITGLTSSFVVVDRVVQFIRARTSAPVVLGGGITSCESAAVMQAIRPDYMVVGEGEVIFKQLLDAIASGSDASDVGGIWCWKDGIPISTGDGETAKTLDELPDPDFELFGMQAHLDLQSADHISYHAMHLEAGRAMPITASRSCPFAVLFAITPEWARINGIVFRWLSIILSDAWKSLMPSKS